MRISSRVAAGFGALILGAGVAAADGHSAHGPNIYPYHTKHNLCPTGLQPVTINGVICCGTPNVNMSYQSAMAHAAAKKRRAAFKPRRADCPVGQKGCN